MDLKMRDAMDKQQLQKLRDLPIEGVAERLGLRVSRHKSLCPFHEDHHASLSFSLRRNTCRCFACMNESLGTIDLVMRRLGKDFRDACRWLANENNILIEEHRPLESPRTAVTQKPSDTQRPSDTQKPFDASRYARFFERPWLSERACEFLYGERRLDVRVVRWCRLTSWQDRQGVNWLQIPYFDQEGHLIGIQNRNLDYRKASPSEGGREGTPRFRFPQGARCSIYNLPVIRMLKEGEPLYITEGCSDCWAMLSSGHKAIAIPSATLLNPSDVETLSGLSARLKTTFHMFPDRDLPGERLFLQLQQLLPNLEHHQLPPGCKDYSEYYLSMGKEAGHG